jgi:DNA-binding CsgD family transcriptional regulator
MIRAKRDKKVIVLGAVLKARFALSNAETEVALALAGGSRLLDISQLRGVTPHTVRSQLKAIFHKTGARSQAQLVALVLRN